MTYNHPWRSQPHRDRDLGHESSLMFLAIGKTTPSIRFDGEREPTIVCTGQIQDLAFFTGQTQSIKFFAFFESSIMCKIGPGSRLGCRACCVSGKALSEGGFALNTRLVYFVSEQVFPSGA